jgi:predicted solute-binding protein
MKNVVSNEILKEEGIDREVLNVYYNICKYYDKSIETINDFIKIERGK